MWPLPFNTPGSVYELGERNITLPINKTVYGDVKVTVLHAGTVLGKQVGEYKNLLPALGARAFCSV